MWRDWLWFVFTLAVYFGAAIAIGLMLAWWVP